MAVLNAPTFVPPAMSVEPTPRWIRVKLGDQTIADSRRALLLIQYGPGRLPTYCFPRADVRTDFLEAIDPTVQDGGLEYLNVRIGDKLVEHAAWIYAHPDSSIAALRDYISFDWFKQLEWFEEAEHIHTHARDPHHRVDVVKSNRHVEVKINGETVADTHQPSLLFETGLPTRYYIPQQDIRMELLKATTASSRCPYKGTASYWSAEIGEKVARNIVWGYLDPIAECPKIKGLLSFYNEKVDIYVDGESLPRPQTPFSD